MTTPDSAPSTPLSPLNIQVVSVQSQVVYGRVGNNVALPVFREHGLEAAAIPTVILSNTPHYPTCNGGAISLEWFQGYLDDLSARNALQAVRAVVAGYLGGPVQADALARWVQALENQRPGLKFVVDPVIGDHDHGVYVDPGMIAAYSQLLLPWAHGLTPNGFELELLSSLPVRSLEEVIVAARSLMALQPGVGSGPGPQNSPVLQSRSIHKNNTKRDDHASGAVGSLTARDQNTAAIVSGTTKTEWVVVTSAAPDTWAEDEIRVVVVTADDARVISHRRVPITPKGTGDLFSAELVACWLNGDSIFAAAKNACDRVLAALDYTRQANCAELLLP